MIPPRRSPKASGSTGWYSTSAWKSRSRAWLAANPYCVTCGLRAQLSDHEPPVKATDREGVLLGPIQSMCWSCHGKKSRAEQSGRPMRPPRDRFDATGRLISDW